MKWLALFPLLSLPLGSFAETLHFDKGRPGALVTGWKIAMTHTGGEPRWEIVHDDTAPSPPNALGQLSHDPTAGRFPLAIWERGILKDGEVSVAFRNVAGEIDQAAGLVWRYQDSNNYYIVRANALEDNVVLYKVAGGVRESIAPKGLPSRAYGVKHAIPRGQWNRIRVSFEGPTFTVYLNDERLFEVEDQTFLAAGKTGLWTKADSVTYFDDFTVRERSK